MKRRMKHIIFILAASICMLGCGMVTQTQTSTQTQAGAQAKRAGIQAVSDSQTGSNMQKAHTFPSVQEEKATSSVQEQEEKATPSVQEQEEEKDLPRMVMFESKLYVDTGETSNSFGRCGVLDGKITSSVSANKKPKKNGQSNFGKGYGLQYGFREGRIDVYIEDSWHVFAYNENNLDGVSMEVVKSTPTRAVLKITNTTDLNIEFGEDYALEVRNKKTGEWSKVPYIIENYGFHSIAYQAPKDRPIKNSVNWRTCYGKLKPGTYRIVKTFCDFRKTKDYTNYTLMTEFKIKR